MTRKKTTFLDKLCGGFSSIDGILTDRSDLYDQTKIHQLEEKINEIDGFEDFNKNNFGNISKISNKKMNLKNSKRF